MSVRTRPPVANPSRLPTPSPSWRRGLCDCGQDPALSCTVLACQCSAAGQTYQRAHGKGCFIIATLLWVFFLTDIVFSEASRQVVEDGGENYKPISMSFATVAGIAGLASATFGTIILCTTRRTMRQQDSIPEGPCGAVDDCCVSFWCGWCSLVQMLRHSSVTGSEYRPCSDTGV